VLPVAGFLVVKAGGTPAVRVNQRSGELPSAMRGSADLIFPYFTAKRIAVNSQKFRSPRLITVSPFQRAFDEAFLELNHRFFKQNSALDHLSHKRFQLFFHDRTLHSDASEYSPHGPVFNRFVIIRTVINRVDGR
jgi:hypothetical protein